MTGPSAAVRLGRRAALVLIALAACGGELAPPSHDAATSTGASTSTSEATSTTSTGDATSTGTPDPDASSSSGGPDGPLTCPDARAEVDVEDDSADPQIRVLYVLPQDGRDAMLDVDGTICNSVFAWTQWLWEQTEGRTLRLDTAADVLDIGFVRLELTDAQMHGTTDAADADTGFAYVRDRIERELLQMGALAPHKIYAVYYGGTSEYACGGGAYPPLIIDQVAAMYLGGEIPGFPACDDAPWGQPDRQPRYIDYAMLHEIMHTLGIADLLAPNQHTVGHVFDSSTRTPERDLLYSQRPGMNDPGWGVNEGLELDLGRDDYFEHGDPRIVDLARSAFVEPRPENAVLPPGW